MATVDISVWDGNGYVSIVGAKWYSGSGAPATSLGKIADWYLNDSNGDVYEKTAVSTWTLRDNLTGPQGTTGAKGDTGATGPAGAVTGQTLYFDNTASDLVLPTVTGTVYAAVNSNPDTITRSSGSFVSDGFIAGQKIKTTGFATSANNGTWVVTAVSATTLTLATIHALTAESAGATVTISIDRERITRAPASGTEQDESQSIVLADGDVTIDTYTTVSGYPGVLEIPAGIWTFHAWAYVSSTAGTVTTMKFQVVKIASTGASTVLFTTAATTVTATSLGAAQEISRTYTVSSPIALATTDRLGIRVVGNNDSATARVLHFVYQGSTRASHVETTLTVAGVGVPVGGSTGASLVKRSASDYDAEWATRSQVFVQTTQPTTARTGDLWVDSDATVAVLNPDDYVTAAGDTMTGALLLSDGSVSAPALANDGDPNTGLYFPAANELALVTDGVARLSIDSAGLITGTGTSLGAWTSYVPALTGFTQGNATCTGGYVQIGKVIHFWAKIAFGNTTSAASAFPLVSLPAPFGSAVLDNSFNGQFYDASTALRYRVGTYCQTSTTVALWVCGTNGVQTSPSTTVPFTWTTSDEIALTGTYGIA